MNIFGVGGAELILIIMIMLVVAGPKRMIRWAYTLGIYAGRLRRMWAEVVDVLQKEMDEAGVDIKIPKELPTRQNISKYVTEIAKPYTKELQQSVNELNATMQDTASATEKLINEAGDDKPRAAARKTVAKPQAATNEVANLGSWSAKSDEVEVPASKPEAGSGFGAWSNPQHPGAQTEQKGT